MLEDGAERAEHAIPHRTRAQAPFRIDLIDEKLLFHAANLVDHVKRHQATRGQQKIAFHGAGLVRRWHAPQLNLAPVTFEKWTVELL